MATTHYICLHGPLDGALVPVDDVPQGYTKMVLRTASQSESKRDEIALVHSQTLMGADYRLHRMLYSQWLTCREEHDANTEYQA